MRKKDKPTDRCGYCSLAEPINEFWNLTLKGNPIAARCNYREYAVLKSELACCHFKSSNYNGDIFRLDGWPKKP